MNSLNYYYEMDRLLPFLLTCWKIVPELQRGNRNVPSRLEDFRNFIFPKGRIKDLTNTLQ